MVPKTLFKQLNFLKHVSDVDASGNRLDPMIQIRSNDYTVYNRKQNFTQSHTQE